MNLGELKKALTRFSGDLDDGDVIFMYKDTNGKVELDLLTFVGYADLDNEKSPAIVLGSMQAALQKLKDGTLSYPDGSKPRNQSFDLNG
jgi:hypothetical protein